MLSIQFNYSKKIADNFFKKNFCVLSSMKEEGAISSVLFTSVLVLLIAGHLYKRINCAM